MTIVEPNTGSEGRTPIENKGRIYTLFCAGWCARKIAKHLKLNESVVRRHAKRLTRDGLIERITKSPAFYQKKAEGRTPLSYYPSAAPSIAEVSRMLPAKFGANFLLITKKGARPIGLKFNSRGTATITEDLGVVPHTFQVHRYKAQLWLHLAAMHGSNPDDVIEKGKAQILELARFYEQKFSLTLTLSRFYNGEEWVMVSKKMSQETADSAGIEPGGRLEVGESIHKFKDFSHPESFQFDTKRGAKNPNSARDDARMHRYLYEQLGDDLEKMGRTVLAEGETILTLKMGHEMLVNELKKKGVL